MNKLLIALAVALTMLAGCDAKDAKDTKAKSQTEQKEEAMAAPKADPTALPETAPAGEPAATDDPAPTGAASDSSDRSKDPAFALQEVDGKYVGRVADACPWTEKNSTTVVPPIAEADYKLVDGKLEVELSYGGCPLWTGYTVVTGEGSPLPFYVCHEIQHDTCEMDGTKKWTFDISAALEANGATAVTFSRP